ncbi:hypothetical protein FBX97_3707 [Herbaspirillum sp. SJZ107]|nr:hypothetical protein FBX97_3707 [Herbaspirillum sp. SJZ107]
MRDDFNQQTKDMLSKRAGAKCSNPGCRQPTSGPSSDDSKAVSIGVAAHIHAASEGGPRYEKFMSPEQRAHISNGIWLCQSCSKLIDVDPARYTVGVLKNWKKQAEAEALAQIEAGRILQTRVTQLTETVEHDEKLDLDIAGDYFVAAASDIRNAAARMALALHEDRPVRVLCNYPEFDKIKPIDDGSVPGAFDSVKLAAYRKEKAAKGRRIAAAIELAFSKACFEPWSLYLQDLDDWYLLLQGIPRAFTADRTTGTVEKLAVWRTDEPAIQTSIRLTEAEVRDVLATTGLAKMDYLAFGAGWRSPDELSKNLILDKVIPNILRALTTSEIGRRPELSQIVNLPSWHIGRD